MISCLGRLRNSLHLLNRHFSLSLLRTQQIGNPSKIEAVQQQFGKNKVQLNIDKARVLEVEEEECNYPLLAKLGLSTDGKQHSLSIPCDEVIKYISMGLINKNLALQYCHYLVQLIKSGPEEHEQYYSKRSLHLLSYLIRNRSDILPENLTKLSCNVAESARSNCLTVCDRFLNSEDLELSPRYYTNILTSCYKFGLWSEADLLLKKYSEKIGFNVKLFDLLVSSLHQSSSMYQSPELDQSSKEKLKAEFFNHFFNLMEVCFRDRVQLITKHKNEFRRHLESFGVKITINPSMKQTGRCTHCESRLPLYDNNVTSTINESIREILERRVLNDVNLYTSQDELKHFEKYLNDIYQVDRKPLDCVIDGLNIGYSNSRGLIMTKQKVSDNVERSIFRQEPGAQVQVLVNTILRSNFLTDYRKILVIGKKHMERWPGLMEFFKRNRIFYYSSSDKSKDDLFQLYAATLNPKTVLVTNDFLRDHLALLEGVSRYSLERWIDTHQVWIERKSLTAIKPTKFEKLPSVDRSTGNFHLPIIDFNRLDEIGFHNPPPHLNSKIMTWFCCKLEDPGQAIN